MKKGGILDLKAAARVVFTDWNNGRISYFILLLKCEENKEYVGVEIVGNWSVEFDVDKVFVVE